MKLITDKQAEAVELCLRHNMPFALFALPGEKECRFFASLPDKEGECHAFRDDDASTDTDNTFFISYFNGDEPYVAGIRPRFDEHTVAEALADGNILPPTDIYPHRMSTRRESYSTAFTRMRQRLRTHGGKVVLSRHETLFSTRPLLDVADEYMASDPLTFRYICYTPETGLWFGVTPELLLATDTASGTFSTMALAGTLPALTDEEWDDKNLLEHRYVADYITTALSDLGLKVDLSPTEELHTGIVKHLCTPVKATGTADPMKVIYSLSPTSAVAGMPLEIAIAEIDTFESHRRRCYAGVVGARIDGDFHAFVNLRCAFAAHADFQKSHGWLYNLYAGGGLMPDSEEEAEWNETVAKTVILSTIIKCDNPSAKEYDLRDAVFTPYNHEPPLL